MALVTVQRSPTPSTTSSPCVSESGSGEDDRRSQPRSISESFLTVKGAALFLPRGNSPTPNSAPRISQRRNKHTGDLQKHLQTMFTVLRPEDTIRLAVRLESAYPQVTRYMVVVSTNGRQDTEESIVLGMDFVSSDSCCTVGLVLPLWSDTLIHLDGDGGFSVSTVNRVHVFKPVSVQAMWSALQSLHKACEVARCHNHYPGSLFLTWVSYYQSRVSSSQVCINEWNAMQDVESHRANSPVLFTDLPTERERTERLIKMRLREIMMQKDLENVTCKEIRTELEMQMVCNLREFKEFIDNEMILILGQMDSPTEIFEHVFLGSEWNASNLEELQNSGVRYILNVTREIDNFFPGMFEYHNIRVYDEEATNLLEYWNDTYKFITKAKKAGAKCLVHCKMGVSRSASTVIAYAMKEYGWDLDTAFDYVKDKRAVTKPNPSFMKQLEEYQGILLASKQRHNKLWRSHSDSDLSDHAGLLCKPVSPSLGRSDSHNNNTTTSTTSSPSLHHFLGVAVLQALGADPVDSSPSNSMSDSHLNGEVDSPDQEELDHPPPPLLRPRAATVVPEERLDNAASVAVTMPVALLHPPPSLHILPPTPELQRAHRGSLTPSSISAPKHKPAELSLDFLEKSCSEDVSPLTLESTDSDAIIFSLSDLTDDKHTPLSPETTSLPPWPASLPLVSSDDNNNPSGPQTNSALDCRGDADGSSIHSGDSIDFFSAREKFLTLAKDGQTRTPSEQAQQRTQQSTEEEPEANEEEEEQGGEISQESPQSDESPSQLPVHHHDNTISVRHIITEIEAICHPASPPSPSFSPHQTPHSHPPIQADPQEQDNEEEEEMGSSQIPQDSSPPSGLPSSPSTLPCDWPPGSVRRATKQLEQKLRQELEMAASQRSPLHSPNTEQLPVMFPPPSPSRAEYPSVTVPLHSSTEQRDPQGESRGSSVSGEAKEKPRKPQKLQPTATTISPESSDLHRASGVSPADMHMPKDSHTNPSHLVSSNLSTESPLDTSAQSQSPNLEQTPQGPEVSSDLKAVDGVTVQESDTDDPQLSCSPGRAECCDAKSRLAYGSQELERIQQTLRELQAFLQEGINLGRTCSEVQEPLQSSGSLEVMDMEVSPEPGVQGVGAEPPLRGRLEGRSLMELTGYHRACELEARLRQAGLTPPSLMKRSASLAKLDCLELSANDLSDLDLRPHIRAPSSSSEHFQDFGSQSQIHPDDIWKKQKVLNQNNCVTQTPASSCDPPSPTSSPIIGPKEDVTEREEPDGSGSSVTSSVRMHVRGHPSRRSRKASVEKKLRATTVLYNTM